MDILFNRGGFGMGFQDFKIGNSGFRFKFQLLNPVLNIRNPVFVEILKIPGFHDREWKSQIFFKRLKEYFTSMTYFLELQYLNINYQIKT